MALVGVDLCKDLADFAELNYGAHIDFVADGMEVPMTYEPMQDKDVPGPKRNFIGYGRHVPRVRWPNDARVAVSFVLNYEEGSEYTHPAGDGRNDGLQEVVYAMDPEYRDLAVESVF